MPRELKTVWGHTPARPFLLAARGLSQGTKMPEPKNISSTAVLRCPGGTRCWRRRQGPFAAIQHDRLRGRADADRRRVAPVGHRGITAIATTLGERGILSLLQVVARVLHGRRRARIGGRPCQLDFPVARASRPCAKAFLFDGRRSWARRPCYIFNGLLELKDIRRNCRRVWARPEGPEEFGRGWSARSAAPGAKPPAKVSNQPEAVT
jgi:hypothetical protein